MLEGATTGITTFNTSLASFLGALLNTAVLISAGVIFTQVGGKGIQREVRGVALVLAFGAFFVKGYSALTTGVMGLF